MIRQAWMAGLAAVCLGGAAFADQAQPPADSTTPNTGSPNAGKPESSLGSNQIVGSIKTIDHSQNAVTINQNGHDQALKLGNSATVFMNGRLGSLDDLKEGQQVRAAYEDRDGQKSVRWIEVTSTDSSNVAPGAGAVGAAGAAGAATESGGATGTNSITGKVISVDPAKNQFVLSQGSQKWTLGVKNDAQIYQNGQLGSFADLKEGQQIRASLDPAKKSATRIDIIPGDATPKTDSKQIPY